MRRLKWFILTVICTAVIALLCGCQKDQTITVNTQLVINSSFDGERVMTASVGQAALDGLFDGNVDLLQSMIERYCPVEMSCSAQASENGAVVSMSVPFATYEEYQNKIEAILAGAGDRVNSSVYDEYSDNLFKTGYTVEEKFCSEDLFYWLNDALKKEFPSLADENLDDLYQEGTTELVFNGSAVTTDRYISYSTMQSHGFKSMAVETILQEDDTIEASLALTISEENEDWFDDLDTTMRRMVPQDGNIAIRTVGGEKTYTISFDALNIQSYVRQMNEILHQDNTIFEMNEQQDDTQTLRANQNIVQYADASYFVDYAQPDAFVSYTVQLPGSLSFETCESKNGYMVDSSYETEDTSSMAVVTMNPSDEITFIFGADISLEEIDVYTKINNNHNLERQITFSLLSEKDAVVGENFMARIQERLNDHISCEREEKDDLVIYTVTIRADSTQQMSAQTAWFLDGSETSETTAFTGGINDKNSLNRIRYAYDDRLDFSGFLGSSQSTNGIIYMFEYPSGYHASFVDASAYEDVAETGNTLVCRTFNKTVSIDTSAWKRNTEGMILQILWYTSLAGILLSILFSLPNLIRCAKARHFSAEEMEMYSKKGRVVVTIFAICAVIFIIDSIRLLFGVY